MAASSFYLQASWYLNTGIHIHIEMYWRYSFWSICVQSVVDNDKPEECSNVQFKVLWRTQFKLHVFSVELILIGVAAELKLIQAQFGREAAYTVDSVPANRRAHRQPFTHIHTYEHVCLPWAKLESFGHAGGSHSNETKPTQAYGDHVNATQNQDLNAKPQNCEADMLISDEKIKMHEPVVGCIIYT